MLHSTENPLVVHPPLEMPGDGRCRGALIDHDVRVKSHPAQGLRPKKALVAFAGIDAPPYQSGQVDVRSRRISKRGSPALRRTLFLVMSVILQHAPADDPVYQFMNRKRAEGKPYRVYMMASANKFLRIYYASVMASLCENNTK